MFGWLKNLVPQTIKNYYHFLVAFSAALFFRFPARKLIVVGVTGTDGKTTTVHLIYHMLAEMRQPVGMISTVMAKIGQEEISTGLHVTTPNPFQIQKLLRRMVNSKIKIAVVEMTSHGLDQNRVAFIPVHTAVITNVTHEHLDYHKKFENYLAAKAKILRKTKYRVLNFDDPSFSELRLRGTGQLFTFGMKADADLRASGVREDVSGLNFKVNLKDRGKKVSEVSVNLPILGRFNVYNVLAALGVVRALEIDEKEASSKLVSFKPVTGRMQLVNEGQDFYVVVDFAHTPAALSSALKSLKFYKHNRIICVFGAAGNRDRLKRPVMGKIAAQLADLSIFTSEDPRAEDPKTIIEQIASGAVEAGGSLNDTFWKIPDRSEAISLAVKNLAEPGDIVAIFGKGHEKSMNIAGKEISWDDVEVARKALQARGVK